MTIKQRCSVDYLCFVFIVLLGVLDQKLSERTFQPNIERGIATLLGEAMGQIRRIKRATTVGNSSVQVLFPSTDSLLQLEAVTNQLKF